MNYTSWEVINSYLAIPEIEYNKQEVEILVWNAINDINIRQMLEQKVMLLEVENHRADLPKGLKEIESVTRYSGLYNDEAYYPPVDEVGLEYNEIVPQYGNVIQTSAQQVSAIIPLLPYSFLTTPFYQNYFSRLKPRNTPNAAKYQCKECPNYYAEDAETYDITVNNQINVSFQEGLLCMSYLSIPVDEYNNLIIYEDEMVLKCIANYVMYKYWEKQLNLRVDGAVSMYKMYQAQYLVTKRDLYGKQVVKSMDYNAMRYLSYGRLKDILMYTFKKGTTR